MAKGYLAGWPENVSAFGYLGVSTGYADRSGGSALAGYENIVVIGASIMFSAFGQDLVTPNQDATDYLGVDGVNIYGFGWSGYTISQIIPKIQEAFAAFPTKTRFDIHIGGNNATGLRPYAGMTQLQLDALEADMDLLYSTIAPRINDCIVADLTFRNYDGDTLYQQENGSLPFIDNQYTPRRLAKFTNSDGRSVLDLHTFVRNNYAVMLSADNVHLTPAGEVMTQQWMIDRTRYTVEGGSMPTPVIDTIPPYEPPVPGDEENIIVKFGSDANTIPDLFTGVMIDDTLFKTGEIVALHDVSGTATPYSLEFSVKNSSDVDIVAGVNTNGIDYGGTFANTLMSDPIHKSSLWWSPNDRIFIKVLGLSPLEQIEVHFVATRVTAAPRFTEIIDSSDPLNLATYATSNTTPDQAAVLTLIENGSGFAEFKVDAQSGTTFAYIGGIQIKPA